MNNLNKKLFRSLLRYNYNNSIIKLCPFQIKLSNFPEISRIFQEIVLKRTKNENNNINLILKNNNQRNKTEISLKSYNNIENSRNSENTLQDMINSLIISHNLKLKHLIIYLFKLYQPENNEIELKIRNELFELLRKLNDLNYNLKELNNDHNYRLKIDSSPSSSSSNKNDNTSISSNIPFIRVGEVVENKILGYRGVCNYWTFDPTSHKQIISLLIDWYDYDQILSGSMPSEHYAEEFNIVRDPRFTRIHHNLLSDFFVRYDPTLGVYIPNFSVTFSHPNDVRVLVESHQNQPASIPQNSNKLKIKNSYLSSSCNLLFIILIF